MKKTILQAIAIAFGALGMLSMILNAFLMDGYSMIAMVICGIICTLSWQCSYVVEDRD